MDNKKELIMKKIISLLIFILVISSTIYAATINITFVWNYNEESDLAGYKLYQSNISGDYTSDAVAIIYRDTNTYTYQIDMEGGIQSYFVLTAFDTSENESGYSNEVPFIFFIDTNAPLTPTIFNIKNYVIIQ